MLSPLDNHPPRRGFRRSAVSHLALAALVATILSAGAVGQNMDNNAADTSFSSGVYVSDSATALDQLALAQRLANMKDWTKSAQLYQEMIEKYRDCVARVHTNDPNLLAQYTSVVAFVNQNLSQWPPEGLAAYRACFEPTAEQLIRSARGDDLAPLHEAFNRYFATDAGREAGLKLIDAYIELGDFSAAGWIGNELLRHPNLQDQRPMVLFRVGLAAHLSGDDSAAQSALRELSGKFAGAIGTIGGRDVILAAELRSQIATAAPRNEVSAADSWPTLCGDVSRDKIYSSDARAAARLYSIHLPKPDWSSVNNDRPDLAEQYKAWNRDQPGVSVGVMPVTDRGELFFQDNAHVFALNLENGTPLHGWRTTYPSTNGQYTSPRGWPMLPGHQFCLTVTDAVVLGVMEMPDLLGGPAGQGSGRLICLDRASGNELWTAAPTDFPLHGSESLVLGGSPLVVGNNVYVAAHGSRRGGYEDCFVICVDLAGGRYRWSSYIAGGLSNRAAVAGQSVNTSLTDPSASLAYSGGRVFVSTNLGAVAALDAYSGTVDWLNIYHDANDGEMVYTPGWQQPDGPPPPSTVPPDWTANPPIVRDGNVFVLPTDGKYILVYDAGDGHVVKRLNKDDCCLASSGDFTGPQYRPTTLLGVLDGVKVSDHGVQRQEDLLLLGAASQVSAINWREYAPAKQRNSALVWTIAQGSTETAHGRAFVTADSLYLPGASALQRIDLATGKAGLDPDDRYPANALWADDEEPGNVLVCADHVIVAGETTVNVYASLPLAQDKLNREVAAAPYDPDARLHYAETMFMAHQPQLALRELDETIHLLRGGEGVPFAAARDRAFRDAMDFAVKSWRPPPNPGRYDLYPRALTEGAAQAGNFFDRAAALAQTPVQQAAYRAARARFARFSDHDLETAIRLYEEILADRGMRTAIVTVEPRDISAPASNGAAPDPGSAMQREDRRQAGVLAEGAIHLIVQDFNGRHAYEPYERAAADEYKAATAAKDPNRFLNVWTVYPNSSVALSAAMLAIYNFEARGMFSQATQVLRQVYPNPLMGTDARRMLVDLTLAHDYLHIPASLESAESRLAAARRIDHAAALPFQLLLPDGKVVAKGTTLDAAIRSVDDLAVRQSMAENSRLPEFGFPSPADRRNYVAKYHREFEPLIRREPASVIERIDKLLSPNEKFARFDRVVTWTAGAGLSIYPISAGQPVGTDETCFDEPRGAAWAGDRSNLLVWSGPALALIDGEQVKPRWTIDLSQQPAMDALYKPEPPKFNLLQRAPPPPQRNGLALNQPVYMRYVPSAAGGAAGTTSSAPSGLETVISVTPVNDVAVLSTSTGRVAAVDLSDGAVVWQIRPADHAPDRVEAGDDFTVIQSGDGSSEQLLILDTRTGRMLAPPSLFSDPAKWPVNLALGDDGNLAITRADAMVIVDLFEIERADTAEHASVNSLVENAKPEGGARLFARMNRPGQLLIHGGQVLALCDGGRRLRGYDVQSNQERDFKVGGGAPQPPTSPPGGDGLEQTVLRIGGRYVYAWNPGSIQAFDLTNSSERWELSIRRGEGEFRGLMLGRDYLAMLSCPAGRQEATQWWMSSVCLAAPERRALDYQAALYDAQGIVNCELLDGGLCYLAGDHTLHFLRGNRNPVPPDGTAN